MIFNKNFYNEIYRKFLELFGPFDPIDPKISIQYDNSFVASKTPAKKIRIFDNFNRLLGEVKQNELKLLSTKIGLNSTIDLINPNLILSLSNNNIKQLIFEITYNT